MRTDKERIAAMHARAAEIKQKNRRRRVKLAQAAAGAGSLAAVILLAFFMPRLIKPEMEPSAGAAEDMQGSIFAANGTLGFVVVAIIAFLLGVTVTLFCLRLKKWKDETDDREH